MTGADDDSGPGTGGDVEAPSLVERGERVVFESGPLTLSFARENGALRRIEDASSGLSLPVTADDAPPLEWTVGGRERRHPPQAAIHYEGARTCGADLGLDDVTVLHGGRSPCVETVATTGDWRLVSEYTLDLTAGRVSLSFDLTYRGGRDEVRLRRARFPLTIEGLGDDWTLDFPGASFPPSTSLGSLEAGTVLEWGARRIHTGLMGLEAPDAGRGLATWAFSREWPVELEVSHRSGDAGRTISPRYELWTAARLAPGEGVSFDGLWFGSVREGWPTWLESFQDWWTDVGLATPRETADWITGAAIFEAHVGAAKFRDGFEYAPYPTMDDLIADLPRIAELGFDAVQLMPRHPVPSYVVVDDHDEQTAWGDPDAVASFVDAAHDEGIRVVLDVVLHGVLDEDLLDRTRSSIAANDLLGDEPDLVAQYVEDHADDWEGRLPDRHRLVREHPDWFVRDDGGDIAHRYTHALDLANPDVGTYFVRRLRSLVDEYDVDGFRLDAPTWNQFPNWDARTAHPAGHAPLGGVTLFRRVREALRREDPEVAIYVEASGPLFRESSDLNYNYDEMWLLDAVLGGGTTRFGDAVPGEISAASMATWLARRNRSLPAGSRTAHHVDSHDTFWWPDPGEKWFRERYGRDAAAAAIAAFALIDGGFMSYAGAETEQEAFLGRILELRSTLPEISRGTCEFRTDCCGDDRVFTALHRHGGRHSIVAVNLSDADLVAGLTPPEQTPAESGREVHDQLADERIAVDVSPGESIDVPFDAYQPRLLAFRPSGSDGGEGPPESATSRRTDVE